MTLRSRIAEYRQPDGLITPKSEREGTESVDATGDGLKHFCVYHAMLVKRGESRPDDFEEFERVVRSCYVRQGLPNRSPTKTGEQISKDALMWICYTAKLMKSRVGWEVLNCGNSNRFLWLKWFYPNMWPRIFDRDVSFPLRFLFNIDLWKSWMGKNPEVVCQMQFAALPAGHSPNIFRQIWLWFFLCVSSVKEGTVYSLAYACCESAKGSNSFGDFFCELWEERINKIGGMKARLAEEYEPTHPFVEFWT